jgi:2-keto-3-deoxy-6-phosphogluconate aldolase
MLGILEALGGMGLVPVVKIEREEDAAELGRACWQAGCHVPR